MVEQQDLERHLSEGVRCAAQTWVIGADGDLDVVEQTVGELFLAREVLLARIRNRPNNVKPRKLCVLVKL